MNDQDLWKRLKSGEKSALREIYDLQLEYMMQYALRFCKDEAVIQDCIHDLFIEIWNKRESIGMTNAIRPYLLVSLRRKLLKLVQQGQKSEGISAFGNYGEEEGAEVLLIKGEEAAHQSKKLQAALSQLSDRQREAIFLKYYEEMDYQQVAEIMNINYQSVRNLIFNGIKKMREILVSLILFMIYVGHFFE